MVAVSVLAEVLALIAVIAGVALLRRSGRGRLFLAGILAFGLVSSPSLASVALARQFSGGSATLLSSTNLNGGGGGWGAEGMVPSWIRAAMPHLAHLNVAGAHLLYQVALGAWFVLAVVMMKPLVGWAISAGLTALSLIVLRADLNPYVAAFRSALGGSLRFRYTVWYWIDLVGALGTLLACLALFGSRNGWWREIGRRVLRSHAAAV